MAQLAESFKKKKKKLCLKSRTCFLVAYSLQGTGLNVIFNSQSTRPFLNMYCHV